MHWVDFEVTEIYRPFSSSLRTKFQNHPVFMFVFCFWLRWNFKNKPRRPQKELGGGMFSTITFLKLVASTDQSALWCVLFENLTISKVFRIPTYLGILEYIHLGVWPIKTLIFSTFFINSGRLLGFISAPVISAFTSAVSIQVATSQVKGLLGLKVHIIRILELSYWTQFITKISPCFCGIAMRRCFLGWSKGVHL